MPFMKASNVVQPAVKSKDVPDLEEAIEEDDDAAALEEPAADVDEEDMDLSKDKYIKKPKAKRAPAKKAAPKKKKGDEDDDDLDDDEAKAKKPRTSKAKGPSKPRAKK
jgi:replication factor C subunit 1